MTDISRYLTRLSEPHRMRLLAALPVVVDIERRAAIITWATSYRFSEDFTYMGPLMAHYHACMLVASHGDQFMPLGPVLNRLYLFHRRRLLREVGYYEPGQ